MKGLKILLFITLIFTLGSCTNNTQNKEITDTINVSNEKEIKINIVNEQNGRIERILIGEFKKELVKNNSTIIDLRTTPELEKSGIIAGAKQIDFYSSDFKEKLNSLDKNKKYLIYCKSGGRSSQTLSLMKKLGFTNVLELQGGMNNWLSSGEKTAKFSTDSIGMNTDSIGMNSDSDLEMMNENISDMMPRIVTLNAKKWEFDQKIIKVKKGQKLKIKVNNIDGLHGIAIPDMKIIGDNEIEVDTSKAGEYKFQCANYCGEGHQDMTGKIIIE